MENKLELPEASPDQTLNWVTPSVSRRMRDS